MLKKFFLNALSSFVGAWIAIVILGVVVTLSCIGIVAKLGASQMTGGVKEGSVLRLYLAGEITETNESREFDASSLLQGNVDRPTPLDMIVEALREAKTNKKIKALYIECEGVSAGPATLNAMLEAVRDFKKSGKKVYAYGDALSQADYYVASAADSLFLNPAGSLDLSGINGTSLYFKDLFDKLGVKFQVFKVGTFKSAVEPFIRNEMSEPARAQLDTMYGNIWKYLKVNMARNRKVTVGHIDSLMNLGLVAVLPAEDILRCKMVDRLVYKPEMKKILARLAGQTPEKLGYVSVKEMIDQTQWAIAYGSKRQIAVLYATGEIAEGTKTGIDCGKLVPVIMDLADDNNVKGLVLRVNSPGGSVFGSDQIGEALNYFKKQGKPFAVSMGDYAASGGYWISCEADRIFADPTTVTGSIGVFGLMPDVTGLMQKIGVSPQSFGTNPKSSSPNIFTPMTEAKSADMQKSVENIYTQFTGRVAKGRKMPLKKVLSIAEGRVWDGETAKGLGLVDQLGGLKAATEWVATKAEMGENYDLATYPRYEPSVWDMIPLGEALGVGSALESYLEAHAGEREMMELGLGILTRKPIQARMLEVKVRL